MNYIRARDRDRTCELRLSPRVSNVGIGLHSSNWVGQSRVRYNKSHMYCLRNNTWELRMSVSYVGVGLHPSSHDPRNYFLFSQDLDFYLL